MAAWRRHAIELFPDYADFLHDKNENLAQFFMEIDIDAAIEHDDQEFLAKVFGYAEWCLRKCYKDLGDLVIAFFYKPIFTSHKEYRHKTLKWISPWVLERISWYLEAKLDAEEMDKAKKIILDGHNNRYRSNWYFKNMQK